ncbi:MAG: glucose-6-phosphate dehydrogenase [Burkholderiaceae bacterium]
MSDAHTTPGDGQALDLVIFGGTGDLSIRKLQPALYMAFVHGGLPADVRIVAIGRRPLDTATYVEQVLGQSRAFISPSSLDDEAWRRFVALIDYVALDAGQPDDYQRLGRALRTGHARQVYYLATAPDLFVGICEQLAHARLLGAHSRVVLEKPLGHDLASAREINRQVGRHFSESQIFRIDHYLGKETVQNLMVLRFGNALFEPLWRAPHIRSVQITVAETVGVGSRAGFYDHTGALRDMVQNHLLQLLCIVAMEPPVSLDPDAVRDEKLKVLRSLRPMTPADVRRDVVRGQYIEGAIDGQAVVGYRQEPGVDPGSTTETFVALRAYVDNWRWANVPFFLRTGKRLNKRRSEIVIHFTDPPFSIFPDEQPRAVNRLMIQLQPEELVRLQILAKEPGSGMQRRPVSLDLDLHAAFTERRAEAYERLLMDVVKGRLTHFMRNDELEAAWAWIEPILHCWNGHGSRPSPYFAGTWGPNPSSTLLTRDDHAWSEDLIE